MALKTKKKSLADTINSLINVVPTNFGSDDESDDTKAKVVQYEESDNSDDEIQQSKFRKQNISLLDQENVRYKGKKISRKDVYGGDSNDDLSEDSQDSIGEESEDESLIKVEGNSEDSDEQDIEDEEESVDDEDNEDQVEKEEDSDDETGSEDDQKYDVTNPLFRDRRGHGNFKTMSETNVQADMRTGHCTRGQLKIWEHLLEIRIKLQKCLVSSNQMPQYDIYSNFSTDAEFSKKSNETKDSLTLLLNNMIQLQDSLLKQYPETKNIDTKSRKRKADTTEEDKGEDSTNEEIPSDTEDEAEEKEDVAEVESGDEEETKPQVPRKKLKLADYEKLLEEKHNSYSEFRKSVIQKWNDKTRIATGNINKGSSQTILRQIEFALNDKVKVRKRTQLKRSEYKIFGKTGTAAEDEDGRRLQEYDPEIYDDDDFYHQLLRDLIEYKSAGVTDPIQLSKQWVQLQKMRNKMKRKIDTRATKGRRVRYNVHNKLVNFMAPITVYDTWTDLAKNELYSSLFGKIKPV